MIKLMLVLAMAAGAVTLVPQPVAAADCTTQYEQCLNDSWDTKGAVQVMADVECFAEYTGCIRRKLVGA